MIKALLFINFRRFKLATSVGYGPIILFIAPFSIPDFRLNTKGFNFAISFNRKEYFRML